jgi:hypothetical protein
MSGLATFGVLIRAGDRVQTRSYRPEGGGLGGFCIDFCRVGALNIAGTVWCRNEGQ